MTTNLRQTVNQRTLLGVQTAANTPVHASKILPLSNITFSPQAETSASRGDGRRYHSAVNVLSEWTQGSVAGDLGYNELPYWLSMLYEYAAPTGTNEKTWVFESDMDCKDDGKLVTLLKGDGCVRADMAHDFEVQSYSETFARNGVTKSATLMGRKMEAGVSQAILTITGSPTGGTFTITYNAHATGDIAYNATAAVVQAALVALDDFADGDIECVGGALPSATIQIFVKNNDHTAASAFTGTSSLTGGTTPAVAFSEVTQSEIAIKKVEPGHVSIYFADAQADLDAATAAVRGLAVTINHNNKRSPSYVLESSYGNEYKESVETPADAQLTFSVVADSEGQVFLDAMRDGATKFMRVECIGPVIGTDMGGTSTENYTYQIDVCFQINAAPSFEDMEGRYANTYSGVVIEDTTWGKGIYRTVINALAAL